jgi:hypothetical protein
MACFFQIQPKIGKQGLFMPERTKYQKKAILRPKIDFSKENDR